MSWWTQTYKSTVYRVSENLSNPGDVLSDLAVRWDATYIEYQFVHLRIERNFCSFDQSL
jgi:hypothetical protein